MPQKISTCDICDAHPDLVQLLPPIFSDYGRVTSFHGPVRTVKCFEDNSKVKSILQTPGDGAVLVVDGGGSLRKSLVGGNVAASAANNGWAGIIVNGAIRDKREIEATQIGLKALALIPQATVKKDVGEVDIEIDVANVRIKPGDYIYADEDGVVLCSSALHQG